MTLRSRLTTLLPSSIRSRAKLDRSTWSEDAKAAVVLGVESVPDGLASGLLAGVNPVAGLYAYLFGALSSSFFTSTTFMAVQGTGAMAIIVADVDAVHNADDPARMLFTLSILTGVVMIAAGYLRLGAVLRFVPNSVMVGFISAVGINIVLGQLGDFTGYASDASNRVSKALDLLFHFWQVDLATTAVGLLTIVLIVKLRSTKLGAMGLVVAVIGGSALAAILLGFDQEVQRVGDVANVPGRLPKFTLPLFGHVPSLIVPAFSLAFVGLVQGAGVSATFVNPDGSKPDTSKDFVGQGVGNVVSGVFQGMPVGGSMSASSLVVSAGARSRMALVFTGGVMAAVILLFSGVVEYVAMPALAGLLIIVGIETVKPAEIVGVFKTGSVQATVMPVTLILTMLIPLQFAVLVGVGISMILYIIRQSNQLTVKQLVLDPGELPLELDPPAEVPPSTVLVLQPYGSLFFAAAPMFEQELPSVTDESTGSVVILRLRGKPELGSTLIEVLERYAGSLRAVDGKLVIVTDSTRIIEQLEATGARATLGTANIYLSTDRLTETVTRATRDAEQWITDHGGTGP